MTKEQFLALGIDDTSGFVIIYLKTGPRPLLMAQLRAPVLESDPPRLLFSYFASEKAPTGIVPSHTSRGQWLDLSIDLEKVHSIQILPPGPQE